MSGSLKTFLANHVLFGLPTLDTCQPTLTPPPQPPTTYAPTIGIIKPNHKIMMMMILKACTEENWTRGKQNCPWISDNIMAAAAAKKTLNQQRFALIPIDILKSASKQQHCFKKVSISYSCSSQDKKIHRYFWSAICLAGWSKGLLSLFTFCY